MDKEILVVTTNDVPGYKVIETYGEVFGLVVRSRNLFSNLGASFRTVVGGEAKGYTKLLAKPANKPLSVCVKMRSKEEPMRCLLCALIPAISARS
jgi:uncharacterized protein YbjQ (UPF0145 family)